jgi:hypothetical protein
MKPTRAEKQRQNKGEKEEEKGRAIKNQTEKGGKEKREYICYFNSLTNISCVTSWHFILLEFG